MAKMSCESPALKMRTFEKFDGSVWRLYESPESLILLTGQGRRLMVGDAIGCLIRDYSVDYADGIEGKQETRRFIAEGGNARVFGMKDSGFAVKEKRPGGESLFESLNRMDLLYHAVTEHCPGWIGIPKHFGIFAQKDDLQKQFLLMEKIDDGVTVGDILHFDMPREAHLQASADRLHGPINEKLISETKKRFEAIKGHLRKALLSEYLNPDQYIPDIDNNPYNICVEPLETTAGRHETKYWVIDQ